MNKLLNKTYTAFTAISLMVLGFALSGCGGKSDGVSTEVVNGTAAVGLPLSGQVSLKDSSATPQQRTTIIGSDGTFAIDVTGLKAPFVLQASGSAAGTNYKLHSFAAKNGRANINPLSDIIVASAAGDANPLDVFNNASPAKCTTINTNLANTVATLMSKLQPLLKQYNSENFNPMTSVYLANHLDMDLMFDNVIVTVSNGNFTIVNRNNSAVIFTSSIINIANGTFDENALPPTAAVPVAPTGPVATGGTGQVTLSWSSVSNATSYNIYYSATSGVTKVSGTKLSSVGTPFVQTGLAAGTTYFYVVTSVNASGESVESAEVSAATAPAPPVPVAPGAPTSVIATGGTNQATLSWGTVDTATSYNVYYSTVSGVTKTNGTKITGATSPTVQTGLIDSTTYYYIVTAVNSAGEGAASVQVAATTLTPVPAPVAPAAPTGVTATGGTNQATISWPAVTNSTSYNIYWSTTSGVTKANGTKVAGVTSPYVKTALSAGTTYYFIVTAVNSVGESAASSQVSAATTAAPVPVPAAPTGVTATGGANQVTISWSPVSGADTYNIYWATASGVTVAGTKITSASRPYVQTGLAASTTYYYIVTAVNSSGQSVASTQVSATTNAPPVVIPGAPSSVTATGGANQITISWPTVSGVTSYNIYWATASGVTTSGTKITSASNPYVHTGLATATTYYYIVTAVNSAGQSVASTQVSAATNAPVVVIPAAPTGVSAVGGATQATITWSAVSGATSYNIYWSITSGVTKTSGAKINNALSPYVQTGRAAGTTYYYIVTAVNSAGESAASTQASAATNAPAASCTTCHAIPPALGEHSFHSFVSCATCHGAGYSTTSVNAATHMNSVKNLTTSIGWNSTSRSCSNSCHGKKSW